MPEGKYRTASGSPAVGETHNVLPSSSTSRMTGGAGRGDCALASSRAASLSVPSASAGSSPGTSPSSATGRVGISVDSSSPPLRPKNSAARMMTAANSAEPPIITAPESPPAAGRRSVRAGNTVSSNGAMSSLPCKGRSGSRGASALAMAAIGTDSGGMASTAAGRIGRVAGATAARDLGGSRMRLMLPRGRFPVGRLPGAIPGGQAARRLLGRSRGVWLRAGDERRQQMRHVARRLTAQLRFFIEHLGHQIGHVLRRRRMDRVQTLGHLGPVAGDPLLHGSARKRHTTGDQFIERATETVEVGARSGACSPRRVRGPGNPRPSHRRG